MFQIGDHARYEHDSQASRCLFGIDLAIGSNKIVTNGSLRPAHQFEVQATSIVTADIDESFIGYCVTSIATLGDEIDVHRISHAVIDARGQTLISMFGRFLHACYALSAVVVVDRDPVFRRSVARLAGYAGDRIETVLHLPHGVVALDAIRIAFEIGDPKLVRYLLRFGFAMQAQEGIAMRCSLPCLDFGGVALFAALYSEHFVWVDRQLPLLVAGIRFAC